MIPLIVLGIIGLITAFWSGPKLDHEPPLMEGISVTHPLPLDPAPEDIYNTATPLHAVEMESTWK